MLETDTQGRVAASYAETPIMEAGRITRWRQQEQLIADLMTRVANLEAQVASNGGPAPGGPERRRGR